jgi:hypothetical protein
MSKKQLVIDTVYKQSSPFYSSTITSLSGSSVALVSNTLNELLAEGKISTRKDGKKKVYTLLDLPPNTTGVNVSVKPICTVAEKFDYIKDVCRMVINGVNPSALIMGRSGVGKTHLVRSVMEEAGLVADKDYLFVSGHTSAFGLYKLLHDNREHFIIFDDCDSCFKDMKSVNLLKCALDSYDIRRVSWFSEKTDDKDDIEPYFNFEGRIIFISNLYAEQIDEAVRSRSFCMNLRMTNDEVTEHMRGIVEKLEPDVALATKLEVLEYVDSISGSFGSYGLRSLIQSIRIREGHTKGNSWKSMIQIVAGSIG